MRLMGYAAVLLAAATCILRDLAPLFGKDPAVGFHIPRAVDLAGARLAPRAARANFTRC